MPRPRAGLVSSRVGPCFVGMVCKYLQDLEYLGGWFINIYGTSNNSGRDLMGFISWLQSLTLSEVFCPGRIQACPHPLCLLSAPHSVPLKAVC